MPAVSVLLDRVIEKSASVAVTVVPVLSAASPAALLDEVAPALLLSPAADVEPEFESLPQAQRAQRQGAGAQPGGQPGEGGDGHGVLQG
jgi:hypothetical protein